MPSTVEPGATIASAANSAWAALAARIEVDRIAKPRDFNGNQAQTALSARPLSVGSADRSGLQANSAWAALTARSEVDRIDKLRGINALAARAA